MVLRRNSIAHKLYQITLRVIKPKSKDFKNKLKINVSCLAVILNYELLKWNFEFVFKIIYAAMYIKYDVKIEN